MKRSVFLLLCLPLAACDGCSSCSNEKKPPQVTPRATASAAPTVPLLPPSIAEKVVPRVTDTAAPTTPTSFGDYHNDKYRFRVQVPATFVADAPSSDGERQSWRTKDGKGEITVTGRPGAGDLAAQFAERTRADGQKLTIDAKLKRPDFFFVQGTEGGHPFYEKRIFAADRHVVLTIRFNGDRIPDDVVRVVETLRFD